MEELDKVTEALEVVERYEDYLFRRAWGRVLLTFGILIPLGFILAMNAQLLAQILDLPEDTIMLLSSTMTAIVVFGLVILSFGSAQAARSKKSNLPPRGMLHAAAIGLIWFVAFLSIGFVPEAFAQVSLLWATGVACICTYVILKLTPGHEDYHEILILSIVLLVVSLPLLAVSEQDIAQYLALTLFSAAFVFGGLYAIATSSRKLSKTK